MQKKGPLAGVKVIEIESIGPGPFCAMLLADLGANVLTVGRPRKDEHGDVAVMNRSRAGRVEADLKNPADRDRVLKLIEQADALIEGFRPGVMERLGLGPAQCHAVNPRLAFGRMTGWGQDGPMAPTAGHDINYIAISGALHAIGSKFSGPLPPLNLVGDFGGGGMMLAFGLVSAVLEARSSGQGQVVDAAMTEGTGLLMSMMYGFKAIGRWQQPRAGNIFDGSHYYYRCYETEDGQWMSVGAIEPPFRKLLFEKLGIGDDAAELMRRDDRDPEVHRELEAIFRSRDRAFWTQHFEGSDACVAPVLSMDEVAAHPHNVARTSFAKYDGVLHPMPAPRFSRTVLDEPRSGGSREAMAAWGL